MLIICRHGIPFVAVHDSYWTYGPYVDDMNKVYSSPLSLSHTHTHTHTLTVLLIFLFLLFLSSHISSIIIIRFVESSSLVYTLSQSSGILLLILRLNLVD